MYIITERHGIFNTDTIPVITCDSKTIYANCNGQTRPISYNAADMALIAEAIKAGVPYIELGN